QKRIFERHEGVVAVDRDPRPGRLGDGCKRLALFENSAAAEQDMADQDEVVGAGAGGVEEPAGKIVERLGSNPGDERIARLFPAGQLAARAVEFTVAGEDAQRTAGAARRGGEQANEKVMRV